MGLITAFRPRLIYLPAVDRSIYVDSINGNNANAGHRTSPLQTIDAAVAAARPGQAIALARGSTFRPAQIVPTTGQRFFAYGTGAAPRVLGSTQVSSASWTNTSGNIYKISSALVCAYHHIWWDNNSGAGAEADVTPLAKGTAASLTANQYELPGDGFLYVNIGRAPVATDRFEVPQVLHVFYVDGVHYTTYDGLKVTYSAADAFNVANTLDTVGTKILNCETAYNVGYGVHYFSGNARDFLIDNLYAHDEVGNQNGVAIHSAATGKVLNSTFRRISAFGLTQSDTASVYAYNLLFDGARVLVINDGGGGGTKYFIKCRSVNEWPEATSGNQAMFFHTNIISATIYVYNFSFARGTGATATRGIWHGGGTMTLRNVPIWGAWDITLRGDNAGGTEIVAPQRDSDYLFVGGGTVNRFKWAASTNDAVLAADPYTSVAGNDLSPKVGSVLLAAGVAVTGITTGTPPDVGYTGAL